MKFGELAKKQLESSKNKLTQKSYKTLRWMVKYYINPFLENYDIEDINSDLLEGSFRKDFLDKRAKEDYVKDAAIRMVKSMIRKAKTENKKDNITNNQNSERE